MYLASTRAAGTPSAPAGVATSPGRSRQLPTTVLALGSVSLLTDISSEMVTATMGMYLMYGLGVGYLALGAFDSLYTAASAVLRLGGGYAADRLDRPKAVALTGYGLSAACKLGFPLAGASPLGISGVTALDRAGKGIRTAPRDAMITAASTPATVGRSFGVHRTMDTCGALLGPLVAFAILWAIPGGYDVVFVSSFCIAAVGVVVLALLVRQPTTEATGGPGFSMRAAVSALTTPAVRRTTAACAVLGLLTAGDLMFFVALQRSADLPAQVLPVLPLGSALVFMLAATPVGAWADRAGRWRVVVAGHIALALAYLLVASPADAPWVVGVGLALHGLFFAATDGVLMAHVGLVVPPEVRATGLAAVQTFQALARAAGALLVGVLAAWLGMDQGFLVLGVGLVAATWVALRLTAGGGHQEVRP